MADPLYRQIAEKIRQQITSGVLPPGSQLPTELQLRETYDASRNTIRDAVKWLIERGYIETRPGRGTFVVDNIDPFVVTLSADPRTGSGGGEGLVYMAEAEAHGRIPEVTVPRIEVQSPSPLITLALELDDTAGAQVILRHQQRRIDGKPWSLQTSFYPMDFVQRGATDLLLAADIQPGAVAYLGEKLGIRQVGYRDIISVRRPNEVESDFFGTGGPGTLPVVEHVRTAYDADGRPFRVTVTVYAGDRNQLAFNVGAVPDRVLAPTAAPPHAGAAAQDASEEAASTENGSQGDAMSISS